MNQDTLLAWPIFAALGLLAAAIKWKPLRPIVAVVIIGYFIFSWMMHLKAVSNPQPPPTQ